MARISSHLLPARSSPRGCLLSSLFLFFTACFPGLAAGQSPLGLLISADFSQQTAIEILTSIEAEHPVRFYYVPEELPGRTFDLSYRAAPLEAVLNDLLAGTYTGFTSYRDYAVVLMPRSMLDEIYTAEYYRTLENALTGPEAAEEGTSTLVVGDISTLRPNGRALVNGAVTDAASGEPIIGATVLWPDQDVGTATDELGRFEAELPNGQHELQVQYVGYKDLIVLVDVLGDGELLLELANEAIALEEVVVRAEAADANVGGGQIGVTRIDVNSVKKLPTLLGETDLVNALLLEPGVSTIGEGATGFNVRGGDADQNLILQDEGFIFNTSHALGFFSTFNADLIKNVELYKGNIPAQYGGRLASVLDVEMRDGNFEQFQVKGGAGPIASRLSLEGPVLRDKSSFLVGGRISYADWFLNLVRIPEVQRSSSFFYDLNLRYTHRLSDRHTIVLSGYSSQDDFVYNETFGFDYSTQMGQLIYKAILSDNVFSRFSATYSDYTSTQQDFAGIDAAEVDNTLRYVKARELLTVTPGNALEFAAGLSAIYYWSQPGARRPLDEESEILPKALEEERALESAAFFNADWEISPAFLITGGLRLALYQFLGPKTIFTYENGLPTGVGAITDTVGYDSGVIHSYSSLEPRLSMRYRLNANSSVKAGYSRTAQFINQIFNSDSPTPSSLWQLSTPYIPPSRSHNASVGYFRNFKNNLWETSIEGYYRWIDQLIEYRDFAELLVNEHLETELLNGVGRAYGLELSIKKNTGRLNGWLSYTYSRTERQVAELNRGDWYPSNFDQPHNLSVVLNFQPSQRHTLTFNFNYNTGRPTTPPVGNYETPLGLVVPLYSERNQLRIPDYHRLDISYTLGQGYNKTKRLKTSWTFAIYNVYGRRNAYSVFFTEGPFQRAEANQLSVLGTALPSVTLNFEFQ